MKVPNVPNVSPQDRAAVLAVVERYAPPQLRLALAAARRLRRVRRLRGLWRRARKAVSS